MFSKLATFFMGLFSGMGYLGICILMTIESSFIPFPSEIIIPPAAYLAAKGEMSVVYIMIASLVGSLLGALINYFLAMSLGRTVIYSFAKTKFAKILLIKPESIKKAEDLFNKNGAASTFFGRLVPGVRQLISIPAGLAKMNLVSFSIFTLIGSFIWNSILIAIGYFFGANETLLQQSYSILKIIGIIIGVIVLTVIILKTVSNKRRKKRETKEKTQK